MTRGRRSKSTNLLKSGGNGNRLERLESPSERAIERRSCRATFGAWKGLKVYDVYRLNE
jgi:hypothetical protein